MIQPKIRTYHRLTICSMPTRYTIELEGLKGVISTDTFKEGTEPRLDARKTIRKAFEERYVTGKNRWFFTPLSKCCGFRARLSSNEDRILMQWESLGQSRAFAVYIGSGVMNAENQPFQSVMLPFEILSRCSDSHKMRYPEEEPRTLFASISTTRGPPGYTSDANILQSISTRASNCGRASDEFHIQL